MFKKLTLATLLIAASSTAFAALPKSSGLYLEGNVGTQKNWKLAATGNVGYKINNNFAIEGGIASISKTYLDVALKGIMPFNSGFNIFAKIGATQTVDLYGGVGVGYSFTPNVSTSLQGIVITDSTTRYAATLGLTYLLPGD